MICGLTPVPRSLWRTLRFAVSKPEAIGRYHQCAFPREDGLDPFLPFRQHHMLGPTVGAHTDMPPEHKPNRLEPQAVGYHLQFPQTTCIRNRSKGAGII